VTFEELKYNLRHAGDFDAEAENLLEASAKVIAPLFTDNFMA
jgi:hypothetical protein